MIKKQLHIILSIFAIAWLVAGCSGKSEAFTNYDVAALLFQSEETPLSTIAHEIQQVKLETTDSTLVSMIWKLFDTGKRLVIIQEDNRCSVFDKTGKYLHDISRQGKGPHEFISIWDAFMEGDTVCLVDRQANKLRFFELDGTPVKEIKTPKQIGSATSVGNGWYAGYMENMSGKRLNRLIYFDENGIQQDSSICAEEYTNKGMPILFLFEAMFFDSGSNQYLKELFNDTIYTMLPDHSLRPRMVLDMGSYSATMEKRHNLTDPNKDFFSNMAQLRIVGENEAYLFFTAVMDKKTYTFYLDKKKNRLHQAHFTGVAGIGPDDHFIPQYISEDNKRILSCIEDEGGEDNPTIIIATINN